MSDAAIGVLQQILQLSADDQHKLLVEYQALVRSSPSAPRISIMELRGLGKEIWQGIDAQRYVDEERASWDG